ncbi:MAG TPA: hypothetical protein VK906_11270 [Egicoccus sp.]|nr:hypothetical protein [Egicoccus sp.]
MLRARPHLGWCRLRDRGIAVFLIVAAGATACATEPSDAVVATCATIRSAAHSTAEWIRGGPPPDLPDAATVNELEGHPELRSAVEQLENELGDRATPLDQGYRDAEDACEAAGYVTPVLPRD